MANTVKCQQKSKDEVLKYSLAANQVSLTCPGKRRQVVTPDMVTETRWLRSPYVGVVSFSVRKQMSYRASLSIQNVSSVFSTS